MPIELSRDLPDEAATAALAQRVAGALNHGLVVYLHGPLGAGKTSFARAWLLALGVGERIKSPTYSLVEGYAAAQRPAWHLDLYRIADPAELEWLGLDALADPAANALSAATLLLAFIGTGSSFLAFAAVAGRLGLSSVSYPTKGIYYLGGLPDRAETIAVFIAMCLWPFAFPLLAFGFAGLCALTTVTRWWWGWRAFAASTLRRAPARTGTTAQLKKLKKQGEPRS